MIFLPLNFLHSILYFFRIKSTKSNVDDSFYLCTNFVHSLDFVQSPLFKSITKWQSIFPTSLSYLFAGQYSMEISLNQFILENNKSSIQNYASDIQLLHLPERASHPPHKAPLAQHIGFQIYRAFLISHTSHFQLPSFPITSEEYRSC